MAGIGGWRERTEKAGPLWYIKDGRLVSDNTPDLPDPMALACPF
jgi:hypothetical protein